MSDTVPKKASPNSGKSRERFALYESELWLFGYTAMLSGIREGCGVALILITR